MRDVRQRSLSDGTIDGMACNSPETATNQDAGQISFAMPPLLLNARQTAKALSISERKLWDLTDTRELPHVHIGRSVRYDPRDLQAWIDGRKGAGQ